MHLVTEEWLPACGSGLNGWNPQRLVATDAPINCRRCNRFLQTTPPPPGQLSLFEDHPDQLALFDFSSWVPIPREP